MPKSLMLLQEDDSGNFMTGLIDHATGNVSIKRKVRSLTSEGMVRGMVVSGSKVGIWSTETQLTIRDFDAEIVHESVALKQYIGGFAAYVGYPFSSVDYAVWGSYNEIFYAVYSRNSVYKIHLIDTSGEEVVESDIAVDFTALANISQGKVFYTPTFIYVVALTNDYFVKVFKQAVGQTTWEEVSSIQCSNQPCFQTYFSNQNRMEKRFYFSATTADRHMDCLVLDLTTGAVTHTPDFVLDFFPTEAGIYPGDTEGFCIETGRPDRYYQGSMLYQNDPLAIGYSANLVLAAGQGQDGVSGAYLFDRAMNITGSYYVALSLSNNKAVRVNFKPDLTEDGIFWGDYYYSACLIITTDGKIQLRNGYRKASSTLIAETAPGFIQGGVYNKLTMICDNVTGDLTISNELNGTPVFHRFAAANFFYGRLGVNALQTTGDVDYKGWHGYVDGMANYSPTWQNFDHYGKTLLDAVPSVDVWDAIVHLVSVQRGLNGYPVGDFIKWNDSNASPSFGYRHALNPALDLAANNIDIGRMFNLALPNGDSTNQSLKGVYDITGTDNIVNITQYSIAVTSRASGSILSEYLGDNANYRELGEDNCVIIIPNLVEKRVIGKVTDISNAPIVGAKMQMVSRDEKQILAETVSDANGDYSFMCYSNRKKVVIAKRSDDESVNYKVRGYLVPEPLA